MWLNTQRQCLWGLSQPVKHQRYVLIDIFSRQGIPEEILADQGTNFTSALVGEKKVLKGEERDWDCMLYTLLTVHVPGSSSGSSRFQSFELLYGRDSRGPLDVLWEEWIQKPETDVDVLSYVMVMRNWMEKAEILEENARVAQAKQKACYDQKTRKLNFQPSDKVLLLLPSSTKNL